MLKQSFKDKLEFDIYVAEEKVRMEKGFLNKSERDLLKTMLDKNYKPVFILEEPINPNIKSVVTNIKELRRPCKYITDKDNVKDIIEILKVTLKSKQGLGLTANQVGINKRISYLKIPKFFNQKTKEWEYNEYILINAKIIEKDNPIKVNNEECLSFPGISIITKRYVYCTVEFYNEKMELQTAMFQDLESLAIQHELDHQNGITIFDRKWRAK